MKICLITFFFSFSLYSGYDFDFGGGGSWWKQKENKTLVKREQCWYFGPCRWFSIEFRTYSGRPRLCLVIGCEKKAHKTLGQSVVTLNWSLPFSRSFFLNGSCKTATLQLVVVFSFFVRHQIEICHSTARLIDTGFCSSVV